MREFENLKMREMQKIVCLLSPKKCSKDQTIVDFDTTCLSSIYIAHLQRFRS